MIRTSNHMITLPIPSTYRNIPCFYRAWCPHLPEMFGDGRGWREHQAPRGAHSPREVGSVSQHRRGLAAGRGRVVGAVFGRSQRDVTHGGGAVLNCNGKCLSGDVSIKSEGKCELDPQTFFNSCFEFQFPRGNQ